MNNVLESTRFLVEHPKYVFINNHKVKEVAKEFAKEELKIPRWDAPVFPETDDIETIVDFLCVGNLVNFAFTDFETGETFSVNYNGHWSGAFGMWAALKRALKETDEQILCGDYLKALTKKDVEKIFAGNPPIPMLEERQIILQEAGEILVDKYGGHFYNLFDKANGKLFNNGGGFVERLVNDFPSYNDSCVAYDGIRARIVHFNKRAQLAAGMIYGRLQDKKPFEDIDKLTVFADYELPKALREMKMLNYTKELREKVDNKIPIDAGSREELEIRAATIHAADKLIKEIDSDYNVNALHVDYALWSVGRNGEIKKPHHLTRTIWY